MIGIATWNFSSGTLASRITRFRDMGFEAMSLIASDAALLCRGEAPDVEETILAHSIPVTIHAAFMREAGVIDERAVLSDFELFASWAARSGILYSINYDAAMRRTSDSMWTYMAEEMRLLLERMLSISVHLGFTVGVEDWPRNQEQLEAVPDLAAYPHYGILLDLGHLNLRISEASGPESPFPVESAREYIEAITLPINELHIHNNDGRRDQHAPLAMGNADIGILASLLRQKGVRGISTIEIAPSLCNISEETALQGAADSLAMWRELF